MKKKFEYNDDTEDFDIDPAHLEAGLAAAKAKKHTAIRITALDYRSSKLSFSPELLATHTWIKKLSLDEDLTPPKEEIKHLERLTQLEALTLLEWAPLDYSGFKKLKELVLVKGSSLTGLDKVRSLKSLYLIHWQNEKLPEETAALTATDVRISASKKLADVSPLFKMKSLTRLMLQDLPKVDPGKAPLKLNLLKEFHVEKTGWTDFSKLHSDSLIELELFSKFKSVGFIQQLKKLRTLYIWECEDGDMTPVLKHPTLQEVFFDKNRKHYTHKMQELEDLLDQKEKAKKKK